jgi:hypothetical protein
MDKVLGWFLVSCGFATLSAGLSLMLWQTRKRALRAESLVDRLVAKRETLAPLDGEMRESALDAIATEVERIGEGQRFLTKALVERSKEPLGDVRPTFRSVTPH